MRRQQLGRGLVLVLALSLSVLPAQSAGPQPANQSAQLRAYWVDAFGPGLFSEAQIDNVVTASKAANLNAIVAQIGRRGDCFCNRAAMPRTQAAIDPYPFDPLQTLIDKAHAQGLQVYAWVIATAIWNSLTPPVDPEHVFNRHGPSQSGPDNWIMLRSDGANRAGSDYLLDPGHPGAADYIVRMYTSLVENYDVDGINFDRVRYPDFTLAANEPSWGYNPVSVDRFQSQSGRTDVPPPTDPEWAQWRRDQVTEIVRRVYLESFALKPLVRVSADTITYGEGPAQQGGWERTRTYVEVLQDWRGWMNEGILDLNIPMNYKREHLDSQRLWYEQWNQFIKEEQHERHAAIGSALYLNQISGSVAQIRKALAPSPAGNSAVGWVGYSYRVPDSLANDGSRTGDASRAELTAALVPAVFPSSVPVPEMGWKAQPTTGHIKGTVRTSGGDPVDQVRVDLYTKSGELTSFRVTDGSGWFGFANVLSGHYKVIVDDEHLHGKHVSPVKLEAGELVTLDLTVKPDKN